MRAEFLLNGPSLRCSGRCRAVRSSMGQGRPGDRGHKDFPSLCGMAPRCPRRAAWDLPGSQAETSVSSFSGSHAHPAAHQTVRGTSGDRIPGIRVFGYPLGAKCLSRRSIPQNTFQKKVLREKRSKDYAKLPLPRKESHAVSAIPCECAQKKSPRCKNDRPDRDGHFCRMENASL